MKLVAYVKDKMTKKRIIIERDYLSKEKFRSDLIGNGYSVTRISNKRDLHVQEYHEFASLLEMKKYYKRFEANELFKDMFDTIAEIEKMEL